jgi:hypothetical protein
VRQAGIPLDRHIVFLRHPAQIGIQSLEAEWQGKLVDTGLVASLGLDRPRPASNRLTAEEATEPEAWFGNRITKQHQRTPSHEIKIAKGI